ncbi:MAG: hypothetical protein F4X97_09805 [Boseongicola sp. SB0662_bin_57]|nr:hypothetical protein [Boseongicola sp. SB0662_bin_57]
MGVVHFLDVSPGDCSIIEHSSARVTVIDVCMARIPSPRGSHSGTGLSALAMAGAPTGFGLAPSPLQSLISGAATAGLPHIQTQQDNPIQYLRDRGIDNIFRFVATHPDLDHIDGITEIFGEFQPVNFWDTANTKQRPAPGVFRECDWTTYQRLRDGTGGHHPKRLVLHSGDSGYFFNQPGPMGQPQDGLHVLAPTRALTALCNRTGDFNDASYVILYRSNAGRILFCGDSHDNTWDHLIENHIDDIRDVELMIAPHHGRDSGRDRSFLTYVRPKLTLFGRAPSEHLAYDAWRNRNLPYITSNQAGTVVIDTNGTAMKVYVGKEPFARSRNRFTFYSEFHRAWYLRSN